MGSVVFAGCVLPPKEAPHPRPLANDTRRSDRRGGAAGGRWLVGVLSGSAARSIDSRGPRRQSDSGAGAGPRGAKRWRRPSPRNPDCCRRANLDASALYQRAPENYLIPPPLAGHTFWMGQAGRNLGWDLDFLGTAGERGASRAGTHPVRATGCGQCQAHARPAPSRRPMSSCTANTRSRTLPSAPRRSARTSSTSRAAGLPPGSIRSSSCGRPKGQLPQARVARDQAQAAADLAVHQLAALTGQGAGAYAID